mgnify:CR=1 FL=1
MAWTAVNPVAIGAATKKSDYDKLWDNADLLYASLPWMIDIDVFNDPLSHVNWNALDADALMFNGGTKRTIAGAQNDEITWPVTLAAGTWSFILLHNTLPSNGIYNVFLDATLVGTIDGYVAGEQWNVTSSIAGIIVATTAKYILKIKMATKNGAASAYYGRIGAVRLLRTA